MTPTKHLLFPRTCLNSCALFGRILSEKATIVGFCLITAIFKVQNSLASFDMILQKVFIDNFSAFIASDWIAKLEFHPQHSQWILLQILNIGNNYFDLLFNKQLLLLLWIIFTYWYLQSFDVQERRRKWCWASWYDQIDLTNEKIQLSCHFYFQSPHKMSFLSSQDDALQKN